MDDKLDSAIDDFTEAIHLDPRNALAYYNRALAYLSIGDPSRAVADCSEAIRLNHQDIDSYVTRAEAYFEMAEYENALNDFQQAFKLQPTHSFALSGLAVSSHALGEVTQAKEYWKLLTALDERYEDLDWAEEKLSWSDMLTEEARQLLPKL